MSSNILEYKGYHTKVEFDAEDQILFGKIEGISDLVNFESDNIKDVETEFHKAVDEYLEYCKEVGKQPDKEYSGTFNIRIKPELHRQLALVSSKMNISLNAAAGQAIEDYVLKNKHHHTKYIPIVNGPDPNKKFLNSNITSIHESTYPYSVKEG